MKKTTKMVLKFKHGRLIDADTGEPISKPVRKPKPDQSKHEMTEEERDAFFDKIDNLTIAKATEVITLVDDLELLQRLDNDARLKGTRQAADSRLQLLKAGEA